MKDFNMRINGVDIGSIQTQVVTANLKVVAPFGAFEPYFLAGAGAMFVTQDKDLALDWDVGNGQFTMKFGAGMDYWLTKNMSLSLGAEVVTNSVKVTFAGNPAGDGEGISYVAGQFGFGFRF
jgi:opacity protein-like surface antigen